MENREWSVHEIQQEATKSSDEVELKKMLTFVIRGENLKGSYDERITLEYYINGLIKKVSSSYRREGR